MLTRAAVATILICIVILLTSACGGGPGGASSGPYIAPQDFVLWQTDPDQGQHVIGYGQIGAQWARVNIFPTSCHPSYDFLLEGTRQTGTGPDMVLKPVDRSAGAQDISVATVHTTRGNSIASLPFTFSFKDAACPGAPLIHAEAREGPLLYHRWRGGLVPGTGGRSGTSVTFNQSEPNPSHIVKIWGVVSLYSAQCTAAAAFIKDMPVPAPSPTQTIDMTLKDGSHMSVAGLPSTIDQTPLPPLNLQFKFTGGPCDGQSFTSTQRP